MAKASGLSVKNIEMDLIDEPYGRVRMEIDPEAIQDLADNIEEVGLLQPIIIRRNKERFEIVAGHRRFLAFRLLEKKRIPAITRDMDNVSCAVARASENLRRVDLSPIEEAAIYGELRDEHKLTSDQIGKRMGKSVGVVKRRLDLLRMPPQLQKAMHLRQIGYSVAEELWSISDDEAFDYLLGITIDHGATQAVVRQWVKERKDAKRREAAGTVGGSPPTAPMEPRPSYVACDLCSGPMEIGTETLYRTCPACSEGIMKAREGSG